RTVDRRTGRGHAPGLLLGHGHPRAVEQRQQQRHRPDHGDRLLPSGRYADGLAGDHDQL
ncbi:hypothetical protein LTR94_036436, partial [Friedmanniomyces endolithicus]